MAIETITYEGSYLGKPFAVVWQDNPRHGWIVSVIVSDARHDYRTHEKPSQTTSYEILRRTLGEKLIGSKASLAEAVS